MIEEIGSSHADARDQTAAFIYQMQTLAHLQKRSDGMREELAALHELLIHVYQHAEGECDWEALCGSESILIADDQVVVRSITQGILESFGYTALVTDADSKTWPVGWPIDMLLLNVPMCDDAALERVREWCQRPARVIVSTHLPEGPACEQLRAAGVRAFVRKPFRPLELARCVRMILDQDRSCAEE